MGRRTKLTPEVQDTITRALAAGNYIVTACDLAGIDTATFWRWMAIGEQSARQPYRDFCDAIKKARSGAEHRNVQLINKAAIDTWQAAAWWLERSFPDRWGRRVQDVRHSGNLSIKVTLEGEDDNG